MADLVLAQGSGIPQATKTRFRDMGDGTHAEVVALSGIGASVPVTGPLTDAELRAVAVPISGTVTATGPLTDAELRAVAVPVSGTVATGGLTDTELRAVAVPVSGTVTATGPQTDAEARATPQPVSAGSELGLAANIHEPGAATAAVVTKGAGGGSVVNVLAQVAWSLSEAPAAAVNLMIEDGAGTTIFSADVTSAGPGFFQFNPPMRGTANTAMVITLASGGGTVVGKVSVHAWTE